ncbi:MAG: hypothetical protein WCF18_02030, partial [Chthoniobacteraceae bacterium]
LIINRSNANAQLYCVDRYGQWIWVADSLSGQTLSVSAQVGQEWIAADAAQRTLGRTRVSRGDNTLWVNEPGAPATVSAYRGAEASVRFENTHYASLYLYNLDARGRWTWMATIEPGGSYGASTAIGESWVATDTSNHVVRQVTVAPGVSVVKLR